MALAPVAYVLWQRFLRFDPADPVWPNRDRFVLSAGHASMLLYALLHLADVRAVDSDYETLGEPAVSMEDIETFRQLDSKAAGHPEYHLTSGVETTTGPLGQGVATCVGMAIAGKWLAGDSTSRLRALRLRRLRDLRRRRHDGGRLARGGLDRRQPAARQPLLDLRQQPHLDRRRHPLTYSDDVAARFMGYGWNVQRVGDANDMELIDQAFERFGNVSGEPTLIIVDSHIGYGSPHKQDTAAAHGEPLGEEEVRETKRAYGWPEDAQFLVPDGVREHFDDGIGKRGAEAPRGMGGAPRRRASR